MEKKIKIAFFIPSLEGGGAEKVMVNLANAFSKDNIDIDLILGNAKGPYLNRLSNKLNVVDLKAKKMIYCLPKLIAYLNRNKPYTLLATLESASVIAIIAKKLSIAKTKIWIRVPNTLSKDNLNADNIKDKYLYPFLMKSLYKYAYGIIAISKGVAKDVSEFLSIPSSKIKVIYNPAFTNEILQLSKENIEYLPWDIDRISLVIGVGRLTKQKNFSMLLKAFSIIRQTIDARLIILGDGEERNNLKLLGEKLNISNDIYFPGFVNNPYAYMRKSSVFVLTSDWEGFGNVIVEALGVGLPVISTDCESGPREILDNGRYGDLVRVGDYLDLANKMKKRILEKNLQTELIKKRASEFSIENIKCKYKKYLLNQEE
jgi:glycosyltransferase involved in cell wall biosynthesis